MEHRIPRTPFWLVFPLQTRKNLLGMGVLHRAHFLEWPVMARYYKNDASESSRCWGYHYICWGNKISYGHFPSITSNYLFSPITHSLYFTDVNSPPLFYPRRLNCEVHVASKSQEVAGYTHRFTYLLCVESGYSLPKDYHLEYCYSQNAALSFRERDKVAGKKEKKHKRKLTPGLTSLPSSYLCSQPTLHHPDIEMRSRCLIHFHTTVGNHKHCFTWEFHISCPQGTKFYQLGLLEEKWQVRYNVWEFRKCLFMYLFTTANIFS